MINQAVYLFPLALRYRRANHHIRASMPQDERYPVSAETMIMARKAR
ncbi:hypothetical protein [Desulfoglaeba alkanexedens]|nr:hypothetical protein [Desulfoglaeba alkanexedens]